jgi:hypothetical protein
MRDTGYSAGASQGSASVTRSIIREGPFARPVPHYTSSVFAVGEDGGRACHTLGSGAARGGGSLPGRRVWTGGVAYYHGSRFSIADRKQQQHSGPQTRHTVGASSHAGAGAGRRGARRCAQDSR